MAFKINEKCVGCGSCVYACPIGAIKLENNVAVIDKDECIDCGSCEAECPVGAPVLE